MRILLIPVLLLSISSLVGAEPSGPVRYLMSEPVSLFDWGIVRLHDYLSEYASHYLQSGSVQDMYGTVSYDVKSNRILLSIVATRKARHQEEPPASARRDAEEICRTVTQTLRREFLADRDKHVRRSLGIYRFFGHVGVIGKEEPPDAFEEIERITLISVSVYSGRDPGRLILESENPLMGQEIRFGEAK